MKNANEIKSLIDQLKPGKTTALRTERQFLVVRQMGGGYEVECGWTVPERNDDDYLSFGGPSQFESRHLCPWVGRQTICADSQSAAEIYVRWRDLVLAGSRVTEGETIGSVVREVA